ncbi:PIG-L family deacetylase [Acinetobacter baumannii]
MPLKPLIICISPHQDDIALSTSLLLHELYTKNSKINCKLISCFTRTNYAPYLQNKSIESISRKRELEDKRYAKKLALDMIEVISIGMNDSPLREEWDRTCDIYRPDNYYKHDYDEMLRYVHELLKKLSNYQEKPELAILPLGLQHKDHIIVSKTSAIRFKDVPILIYEDVPYRFDIDNEDIKKRVKDIESSTGKKLIFIKSRNKFNQDLWVNLLNCYKSQFSKEEIENMANKLNNKGGENYWACSAAINLLESMNINLELINKFGNQEEKVK